jgi:pimeloyl-ACP methyl ester carboxylesterase
MARDTVGLLDALGIGSAHVVGASMGGMIAQLVAASRRIGPALTSIMSSTGARYLPQAVPGAAPVCCAGPRTQPVSTP